MLAQNLKKIRKELGLSMAKFSEKLEIPAMTLTHYERGERTPSAQLFIQLDKKLDINLNWLVSGRGSMFNREETQNKIDENMKETVFACMLQILKQNGFVK